MLKYEKWIPPLLLVFSTILKIGSIVTLYSVYAHSTTAIDAKTKASLIKPSLINSRRLQLQ